MKLHKLIALVLALAMMALWSAFPASADETAENVIFICDGAEGDGSSADSPLKPTTGNYDPTQPFPDRDMDTALYQAWEKLMKLGVLCVEMEAHALYLNAAAAGKNALALLTISDSLVTGEALSAEDRQNTFTKMMEIALEIA